MYAEADELVRLLWPSPPIDARLCNGDSADHLTSTAYNNYCQRQWTLVDEGKCVTAKSASEISAIVGQLRDDATREEVSDTLRAANPLSSEDLCEQSIDFTARLLLMLKLGVIKHQAIPRRCLRWSDGSLKGYLNTHFSEGPKLGCDRVRLEKAFNAWSIAMIGGIEIDFTDNLADHLLLVDDDTKLLIFHHASFLEFQHW